MTGEQITMADALLVSLKNIVDRDASILELADLSRGWIAQRNSLEAPWQRIACKARPPGRSISSRHLPFREWWYLDPLLGILTFIFRFPFVAFRTWQEKRAFRKGMETAWKYCESTWDRDYAHVWHGLMRTTFRPAWPYATSLIRRFQEEFSNHPRYTEFVLAKTRTEDPVIAAYAVQCLPDPNQLAQEVRNRNEIIALRDWYLEQRWSFGEWVLNLIWEHSRSIVDEGKFEMRDLAKRGADQSARSTDASHGGSPNNAIDQESPG